MINQLFSLTTSRILRFLVNATLSSTVSSPLESPDILQRFVPAVDVGATTTSMASIKLSSADSINTKSQQVRSIRLSSFTNTSTSYQYYSTPSTTHMPQSNNLSAISMLGGLTENIIGESSNSKSSSLKTISEFPTVPTSSGSMTSNRAAINNGHIIARGYDLNSQSANRSFLEFSLSSVGRSFIDETEETDEVAVACDTLKTPDTPTPNISPSTSSNRFSETFSNDFIKAPSTPSCVVSPLSEVANKALLPTKNDGSNFAGSWDLIELDLNFHDVNYDPSFGGDVEECVFFGDDPLGILPRKPTLPDSHDL